MKFVCKLSAVLNAILFFSFFSATATQVIAADTLNISGVARVIHYSKKDFQGDPQFWAICQDTEGVLYFGNNDGTLVFDGQEWQKVLLPNNSSTRSLVVSSTGEVYAGGYNEFGKIKKDQYGKYYYESMVQLLRVEDRNIENIWAIHEVQGHMVFRSFKMLVAVANGKAIALPTSGSYELSLTLNDRLFVNDADGFKSLDLNSLAFTTLFTAKDFDNEELLTLIPGVTKGEIVAITKPGSVFSVDLGNKKTQRRQRLLAPGSNNLITCAIKSSGGEYYLGTLRTKVLSLSISGNELNTSQPFSNLQDNSVHNLFQGIDGNIWVALNNGIDCIDIKSPASMIFEDASAYDALRFDDRIYVATNQGVFVSEKNTTKKILSKQDFKNMAGLEGQAWTLQQFDNHVICSHDRGVFVIDGASAKKIAGLPGIWKVIPLKNKPHHYLACGYHGMYLITYDERNGFVYRNELEGFTESSRDILQGDQPGVFWICHGYKGVFKIKIDDAFRRVVSVEHFKDQNGLPSPFNINVARWKGDVIFTTNHGIYTYNEAQNKFVPHNFLTNLFGTHLNVRRIFEYGDKTWFAHDNEVGYFMSNDSDPKLQKDLFLQLKGTFNPSMECIVPLSENNILIGTNVGLYAFDLDYDAAARGLTTLITSVHYRNADDENETFLPLTTSGYEKLPYKTGSITFNFSAPAFQNKPNVQYSYRLEGVDNNWSPWNENSFKEYSLISPGKYTFKVKSRSLLGEKGVEAAYQFQILPAWYQSMWAIAMYFIVSVFIVVAGVILVKRRINLEKEKTLAEELEKRRVLELEIERMKLAGEKAKILKDKAQLEEDVIYKSKELVNYTMLLVKKRELLTEMQDDLKVLKEVVKNDASRQTVRELLKKINTNLESEEHIKVFEANFERVHHNFFTRLKNSFQDLTPKELQLCAFVRMNLTNKEIASILNISVRGIETARYRLRKRLGMSHEEDMAEFLEKLHGDGDSSPDEVIQVTVNQ